MAEGGGWSPPRMVVDGGEAGSALLEQLEAEVAALLGPLVVLFGQDGADEADNGLAIGKNADDVGAAADLAVEPFVGVVGPDLAPHRLGEGGEGQDVPAGTFEVVGDGGQLLGRRP